MPLPTCPAFGNCVAFHVDKCSRRHRCEATARLLTAAGAPPIDHHEDLPEVAEPRDPRLGLAIVLASAMVALGFAWFAWARWLNRPTPAPVPPAVSYTCPAPREGTRMVITVTHERGALTVACRAIGDWRNP